MSDTDTAQRAEDLPDDIGPVHQTSGFVETAKTPEHGDLEIGLKNGDGYLKLVPFPDSDVMEFTQFKAEAPSSRSAGLPTGRKHKRVGRGGSRHPLNQTAPHSQF